VHETRNTILGAFTSVHPCKECDGAGKIPKERCEECRGKGVRRHEEEITVEIPVGIDDGEMIRLPQQGEAVKDGISGDLYVKIHVKPHSVFRKEGMNLVMDLPIKMTDALLGTKINVTLVNEKVIEVKVPPLERAEEILRVRGKGVVVAHGKGDLLIHVTITLPKKISSRAKKAVEELKKEGL